MLIGVSMLHSLLGLGADEVLGWMELHTSLRIFLFVTISLPLGLCILGLLDLDGPGGVIQPHSVLCSLPIAVFEAGSGEGLGGL